MLPFNKYPYTDFHEMNLDWIVGKLKDLDTDTIKKLLAEMYEKLQGEIDDIDTWIKNYDESFVREEVAKYVATMIFVEIGDGGYIIYNIPEQWADILFNTTGWDTEVPGVEDGHLILSY